MYGFVVIFAFVGLFVLGFPVVLALAIPCVIYVLLNDLPQGQWRYLRSDERF